MALKESDLWVVYEETYEARNKWVNILLSLGVSKSTITSLDTQGRGVSGDCYREGLAEWLNGGQGHWRHMVKALSSPTVGYIGLARSIAKKYMDVAIEEVIDGVVPANVDHESTVLTASSSSEKQPLKPQQDTEHCQVLNAVKVTSDGPCTESSSHESTEAHCTQKRDALSLSETAQETAHAKGGATQTSSTVAHTETQQPATKSSLLDGLPILDCMDDPPPNHTASLEREQSNPCAQASPQQQEGPQDLSGVLTKISKYAGCDGAEKLRFIVTGILDQELTRESPMDIFYMLLDKHDSCSDAEAETTRTFAATIFKKALQCANFDSSRVQTMTPFCKGGGFKDEENLTQKMNFRKELLNLGDQFSEEASLQRLAEEFTEEQLGCSRRDIKTPIQLFQGLLMSLVISFESRTESIQMLSNCWERVNNKKRSESIQERSNGNKTSPNNVQGMLEDENGAVGNDDGGGADGATVRVPPCQRNCKLVMKILVGLAFTEIILIFAFTGLATHFGVLSTRSLLIPTTTIYGNNTIFVAKEPLNTLFTASINFQLNIRQSSPTSVVEVCQVDCTHSPPPTRSISLNISESSTPRQRFPSNAQQRLISFTGSTNFDHVSLYLLGGSHIRFSIATENISELIQLYIFNNRTYCSQFLLAGSSNFTFRTFELNKENNFIADFAVPPNAQDAYYCGVWVVPTINQSSTLTFQYSVEGSQVVYDIDRSDVVCMSPLSSCTESDFDYCYDLFFVLSFVSQSTCVFFAQLTPFSDATVLIQTFSTFKNPAFGFLVGITIFMVIALLFAIIFLFTLVCWCRNKKSKPLTV